MRIRPAVWAAFVLVIAAFPLNAGDIATFVNLGFSDESSFFMFGVYGTDADAGKPYAEIYTVDVKANKFITGGVKKESYAATLQPGQDASGALYNILEQSGPISKKYGVNHLKQGRLLYLLVNGEKTKETLEFRDFNGSTQYKVKLFQNRKDQNGQIRSAFHIELAATLKDGRTKTYTIGLPDFYREKVLEYRIRQILISPDEKNLVFLIEKDVDGPKGKSIRYMVETVKAY